MVFAFSCDDIFVKDITARVIQIKAPSSGWKSTDNKVSFRWEEVPDAVNYQLEVVTPGFSVDHKLVFETMLTAAKFDTSLISGDYQWRIKASNSASETAYFTSSFTILHPLNIASQQVSLKMPEDQFVSTKSEVNFSWDVLKDASFYSLKIKKLNWVGDSVVVAKLYSPNFNFSLEDGVYAWGVAAIDTLTNKKTDYAIRSITIDKNPPSVPVIVTPANRDTLYTLIDCFTWRKTGPNVTYLIDIYTDPELKNKVIEKTLADTVVYINMEKNGYYYWNVKSIDQHGNYSNFSPVSSFCIQLSGDIQKNVIMLMSPTDKSTIVDKKVTFWWNTLSGAQKYNLQVATPTFTNPVKLIYDQWVTTNFISLDLEPGNYEWRVKASNSTGETNYSQSSFSIYNNDLTKQKTTLLKPLYGEQINNSSATLSWEKINSSATYHLLIKKDSWETGTIVQEMSTSKTEIELPFLNGEYFWGVKAIDPQNSSETEYSIRKFVVDFKKGLTGTVVLLMSPADKSTIIEKKVTFWWNQLNGAEKYNLQIASPSFSNPVKLIYDQWITDISAIVELEPGSYEWRVKASNSTSETGFSQSSFSIYNNDLTKQKTTLLKPLYAEMLNTPTVKFRWEKLNNNASYHILIKMDSWESGTVVQEMNTSNTELELSFLYGEYFWGIKAIDPLNNSETEYSIRKFGVDLTKPEIPKLKSPENQMVTEDHLLDFTWEPTDVSDTKLTYTLEIYQIINNVDILLTSKITQQKLIEYNIDAAGKYKWRIYATDNAGNKSTFSEYRYFEIQNKINLSLVNVSLISPASKSTVIDKKVTFWWNSLNGAEKYNLQIVSPSFSNPLELISDQWVTTNSFTMELPAGNYEWRVKAANSFSETTFSLSSFSIYNNDLSSQKITLIKPLYDEILNHSSVKFIWEKLNSNANYHLLVKKDSWETGTIIQEMNTNKTELELSFMDGNYYLGVKAVDPENNSETAYSIRKFAIDLIAPEIPKLNAPANNLATHDYLINFSWDPGDLTDTKLTYTLEMYEIRNGSVIQLATKTTQQKSLGYNFESVGKYKWRVYATDNAGNQSAFSEYRYFEIQ
jgi:uncharacterized protein YegP (UPF0339 family)